MTKSTSSCRLLASLLLAACQAPARPADPAAGAPPSGGAPSGAVEAAPARTARADAPSAAGGTASAVAAAERVERYRIPASAAAWRGPSGARVTLVEVIDYQCPFCARAEGTVAELERAYPNDLRVQVRHNPLPMHASARTAALAATAAGAQGRFWEMHDALFRASERLAEGPLTRADLDGLARGAGLDVATFDAALDDPATAAAVDADLAIARQLGVLGTPSFFVNGRLVRGAQPLSVFKEIIDAELAAPAQPYDALIAGGLEQPSAADSAEAAGGCKGGAGCAPGGNCAGHDCKGACDCARCPKAK